MAEETDGIEEAFEGQLRVLVTATSQIAERIAREREQALRQAEARSQQEARELQSRMEAERRAARAELSNVYREQWWNQASPEQIGHAYQVARAWEREDPEAVRAQQRMRDELRTRYGVDVNATEPLPVLVPRPVERARHVLAVVEPDVVADVDDAVVDVAQVVDHGAVDVADVRHVLVDDGDDRDPVVQDVVELHVLAEGQRRGVLVGVGKTRVRARGAGSGVASPR